MLVFNKQWEACLVGLVNRLFRHKWYRVVTKGRETIMNKLIFDTETVLELLTQTAIEQYILSGIGAEDTVCGLVSIARELEKEGVITEEQLAMAKDAIEEWKQKDKEIQAPEMPDALKVQDSIEWLEEFMAGREDPILQEAKQFYIDYWMTAL